MATNIKGLTIAATYDRIVLIEDGDDIGGTTDAVNLEIQTQAGVATGTSLFLSTARVGINETAPDATLHLKSTTPWIDIEDSDSGTADDRGKIGMDGDSMYISVTKSGGNIYFKDGTDDTGNPSGTGDYNMTILGTGLVGIGTTSPKEQLDIASSSTSTGGVLALTCTDGTIVDNDVLGSIKWYGEDSQITGTRTPSAEIRSLATSTHGDSTDTHDSGGDLRFFTQNDTTDDTSDTVRMIIDQDGNVGIGTTSPDYKFEIEGTGDPTLEGVISATALTNTDFVGWGVMGTGNGEENVARIAVKYNAAAETDAPTAYLRLDESGGTASFVFVNENSELAITNTVGLIGKAEGTGSTTVVGDQDSDERLKDISSDAFPYGLSQINALTPIRFTYKNDSYDRNYLGFGAQSTKDIVPESVKHTQECIDGYDVDNATDTSTPKSDNTDYKYTMQYRQIIPVLVKAIQELSAKVTALENA